MKKTKFKIKDKPVTIVEPKQYMTQVVTSEGTDWFVESIIKTEFYKLLPNKKVQEGIGKLHICAIDDGLVKHKNLKSIEYKIRRISFNGIVSDATRDLSGHGTHIAGSLVGTMQVGNGDIGTGLLFNCKQYTHMKITDNNFGTVDDLNKALKQLLDFPKEARPDLLNLSLTIAIREQDYAEDVILASSRLGQLAKDGMLIFCAAGNIGWHGLPFPDPLNGDRITWPARLNCVEAVGNIDFNNKVYVLSSQGKQIDCVSYGVKIVSLSNNSVGYAIRTGTSMASPRHLSNVGVFLGYLIGVMGYSKEQVKKIYKEKARELGLWKDVDAQGWDVNTGLGLLLWNQ